MVCPAWLRLEGDTFQVIEKRADVIRLIFQLAADGMASHSICRALNDRGVPLLSERTTGRANGGKEGRRWHAASINRYLRSRSVLGEHQPCRYVDGKQVPEGDPIPDFFPAIVEPSLWQRAANVRRRTGFSKGKRSRAVNLLQGITFCDNCGGVMQTAMSTRGDGYIRAWVCSDKTQTDHKCKNGRWFPYPDVEAALLDNIKELRLSDVLRDPTVDTQVRAIENEIFALNNRATDLEKRQSRLVSLIEVANTDEVEDLVTALRERRVEIRQIKETLQIRAGEREELLLTQRARAEVEGVIADIRERLKTADETTTTILRTKLQSAIRSYVSAVRFHPGTGVITVILVNGVAAHQFQQTGSARSRGRLREIKYMRGVSLKQFLPLDMIRREVFTTSPSTDAEEDPDRIDAFNKIIAG
jgi:hypothetical protein